MKHILNNLSEQEKNSIREQHAGGMKVMTESFSKLLNSKLGDVKPMVSEQPNFGFDVLDMELPNQDKMRNLFLSKDDDIPELKGMSDEVKKVMNACVSENNLYKVKGFLDGIETKKMNFLNTIMANLFDNKMGGKSIGQEFNEFQKCVSKKIGGKLNTLLPNKSISEQEQERDWSFLDERYVNKLKQEGFKEVPKVALPDGTYMKFGSGYNIYLYDSDKKDTGYVLVTKDGIRGAWNGDPIEIVNGTISPKHWSNPNGVYKTLFNKDVVGQLN
jgi:hypothetical protein